MSEAYIFFLHIIQKVRRLHKYFGYDDDMRIGERKMRIHVYSHILCSSRAVLKTELKQVDLCIYLCVWQEFL